MSSRRYAESNYTYDDRRERDYVSRAGSRYDDRYEDREIEFRRSAPPVRERERERDREEIEIREDRTRARDPPAFLREDYGRTSAGPVVLRAREKEEFDFVPRARRRSPSPESDRRTERDSIIIRRDREETESRPPPRRERERERERSVEREEIIIRRDDRERSRAAPAPPPPPPPPPQDDIEREEIIIRRSERSRSRPPPARDEGETERIVIRRRDDDRASRYEAPPPPREYEREEIIIRRRDEDDRASRYEAPPPPPPPPKEVDREEIIIRRTRDDDTKSIASAPSRRDLESTVSRAKSRERERHDSSDSEHEVIIRRDEIKGRGRDNTRSREEIIIRSKSHSSSRSPSPAPSMRSARSTRSSRPPAPAPEPQIVYAPQIHQEVITHHRHVDHGYELAIPQRSRPISRPVSRPPSPPSPPPPEPSPPPPAPPPAREQSEERIEIRRSESRNGRTSYEDIIIDRNEGARSVPPPSERGYDPPERRESRYRDERDFEEEAEYYNQRALERSYPGEGWHGATRDWALIDVPPGTRRVRMDGAGGGAQEITWQRYNGMRRSKFYADADDDEVYSNYEVSRPAPPPAPLPRPEPLPSTGGDIGRRYGKTKDPKAGLWTEITKDLVVKEAITEMGYEYEETDEFYYIIAYMKYEDVARLVGLSEDIRKDRRKRVQELEWETKIEPEPLSPRRPLAIEPPPPVRSPRSVYEREDERYIEREYYRGPPRRRPPPPGWR